MNADSIISCIKGISAIKWILMILLTGFIAQFGKMLAEYLIRKATNRKISPASPAHETGEEQIAVSETPDASKSRLKADKKAEKAAQKRMKKEGS